ncbi:hypothetical protein [Clostridium chauvoei]|uniref:hypothetical protein n=1 Tax=Clostridium chauvoei TaxID=46867 RepID=UPI001C84FABA|nr:hypothetical protein [Clostridium chauvoei]MBX7324836.1 hypothetical protein [Clostridium chauvoei]
MKSTLEKIDFLKNQLSNSDFIKKEIDVFSLINYTLKIKLRALTLDTLGDITVILKNIKTKEIYICDSYFNGKILEVHLDSLNYLCTDNEYMPLIVIKESDTIKILYPILKKNYVQIFNDYDALLSSPVSWYVRALDNGEFRLSTIVKSNFCS